MKKRSALIVKEADAMSRSKVLCDILDTEMKYLLFYSSNILRSDKITFLLVLLVQGMLWSPAYVSIKHFVYHVTDMDSS